MVGENRSCVFCSWMSYQDKMQLTSFIYLVTKHNDYECATKDRVYRLGKYGYPHCKKFASRGL